MAKIKKANPNRVKTWGEGGGKERGGRALVNETISASKQNGLGGGGERRWGDGGGRGGRGMREMGQKRREIKRGTGEGEG
jgi:hypothetical protein